MPVESEMLVRIVEKVNPDSPYLDVKLLKFGDVVEVRPAGWPWTPLEINNPEWLILQINNMPVDEAMAYLVPEAGDPLTNPMLQRRQFYVPDVAKLTRPPSGILTLNAQTVRNAKTTKPPVQNPAVMGEINPKVFG